MDSSETWQRNTTYLGESSSIKKVCYNMIIKGRTMQILTIKVKDAFMAEFIKLIDTVKDNVVIQKDKNLELDPYFYERQNKLNQIVDNMNKDSSKLTKFEDFEIEMDKLEKDLDEEYAS